MEEDKSMHSPASANDPGGTDNNNSNYLLKLEEECRITTEIYMEALKKQENVYYIKSLGEMIRSLRAEIKALREDQFRRS